MAAIRGCRGRDAGVRWQRSEDVEKGMLGSNSSDERISRKDYISSMEAITIY